MDGGDQLHRASSSRWRNNSKEAFSRSSSREEDDEEALKWATLEKLPTFDRLRKGILTSSRGCGGSEIDMRNLGLQERKNLIERLVNVAEVDNDKFLFKLKNRIDRVGIELPKIEVRFEHLNVEAEAYVGSRALPTFLNFHINIIEGFLNYLHIIPSRKEQLKILNNVSGIIKPSRLTLLLGPPGSGKTTLLLALAGKLDSTLKVSGGVTYNGHDMHEFVPQRTAAYISQHDVHIGELTVRETLAFSARCQGVGSRYEMLAELSRREKAANIKPDLDIDVFMKAAATEGQEANVVTDYILKILGLEVCADTMVGDEMLRGISGGQRKRVTTGEMLVGPSNALFMDEISTGLDSSTTFQIVNSLRQYVHILNGTALISLLQPTPETYNLFDDIILLSDGQIVYQGPREQVLDFFEYMGFKCPERKGVADFLQEVTSRKDQQQYWACQNEPYRFVTVKKFSEAFQSFHVGRKLGDELGTPFDKKESHPAALTTKNYGVGKKELLKACISREYLLMRRNSFVYIFKLMQLTIMAMVSMSLFFRTNMHQESLSDGNIYTGALFFAVVMIMFNGFSEISMTVAKLSVFYKQRDLGFFPSWSYALPTWILKIPITFVEVSVWVLFTYYATGYDPNAGRFFKQYMLLLFVNQMASGLFRLIAATGRNIIVANTFGSFALFLLYSMGGFVLSREDIKKWWIWVYWCSPLMYGQNAIMVNEFLGHSWDKILPNSTETLGVAVLKSHGFFTEAYWYWLGVGAMIVFILLFNFGFTLALTFLNPFDKAQMVIPEKPQRDDDDNRSGGAIQLSTSESSSGHRSPSGSEDEIRRRSSSSKSSYIKEAAIDGKKRGMVLPFEPYSFNFDEITYSVNMPREMKNQGVLDDKLVLLKGVSGSFRPGVLTALMGVSGAAWLRLPPDVNSETQKMFIEEVMEIVELKPLRHALVGLPGVNGLDARAAAIVMRTVRNTVDTGRTVVCTIHQPSINIFEAFDELVLLRRGGQEIYVGPLGHHSCHVIQYFEAIEGVNKIKDSYNPATWMLEVTTVAQELNLGVDFAEIYKNSDLYRRNKALIKDLSKPAPALGYGTMFWDLGSKMKKRQDLFNAMGSMYGAGLFLGIQNSESVQPVVAVERTVFYRERAAGMYSALPYAVAQALIGIPYIFAQAVAYVAMTPNLHIAKIVSAAFYGIFNLFSGFVIPRTRIPIWWICSSLRVAISSSRWSNNSMEAISRSSSREEDDEEALKWAALERLPTFDRLRKGILTTSRGGANEIDVSNLELQERRKLIERLVNVAQVDNDDKFLFKLKNRFDRVGIELPKIEVRFEHLNVEAEAYVGSRALPTFFNFSINIIEGFLNYLHIISSRKEHLTILNDVSGIIKPSRLTLLLGPPGSGKTTLLLALAGKLDSTLKVSGGLTYNGHGMHEFVPQRTAAYISQHDVHMGEMTVRETLAFSARCQGVGSRYEMLAELSRREKAANIKPDLDIDVFMKAAATEGQEANVVTDYILKILGLEVCADTIVGDEMLRGISGGQRKRVTTGEMLVGPAKALFMDDISTGLDSSTTFQIVNYLKQYVHILNGTALISLLQPAPETYNLFDDIILLSDGQIVYQGPREQVLDFFEYMGFKCPERKGVADFLQEVTSRKDQQQYWAHQNEPYRFVTVKEFAEAFQSFHVGRKLSDELGTPFDKKKSHPAALTTKNYGVGKKELLKACISREFLLMKRNSFVYFFKLTQLTIMAMVSMSLFFRTTMHRESLTDGIIYTGALFFTVIMIMFNGLSEISMTIAKLAVFYKQRDLRFYPSWSYALPTWILKIPITFVEVAVWVFLTYYVTGYDPNVGRLFKQYLLLVFVNQMASGLFRLIAATGRNIIVANTFGSFVVLLLFALGGFVLSRDDIKKWWTWAYWCSPLMYSQNAIVVNEFLGQSWDKILPNSTETLGVAVLKSRGFFTEAYWYWLGVGALIGFTLLFNFGFTLALTYLNPFDKARMVIPEEPQRDDDNRSGGAIQLSTHGSSSGHRPLSESEDEIRRRSSSSKSSYIKEAAIEADHRKKRGMVLPFEPYSINFDEIMYSVDMPQEMKNQGVFDEKLVLLKGVSGAFRPGVLTALMGVSGAAWLRLPPDVNSKTQKMFIEEIMELVELKPLRQALVGLPGVNGLDARAAAIVMRTVRNTVDTGRTVVCTIHQPSIDIFESFDELLLLKRGGQEIYVGPLGRNSSHVIKYFEAIDGVNKIKDGYNPATWMLEPSHTLLLRL
ncbi:hypothetical protein Q3G72_010784 [Acer saccharum]|nr:hypothetical protein Q3G72_010784 [Acer saccharum]